MALVAISFKLSEVIQHVIPQSNVLLTILVSFFGDQYLLLTTLTLLAVAIWGDFFDKLAGSSEIGTFIIYIFFVVIGTPALIYDDYQNSTTIICLCDDYFNFQSRFKFNTRKVI